MLPPLNVLSDSYEISLKPLRFTVTKWRFSNVSQLKLNLWQWDDNNTVILISSILRPPPTVLIRTCTCCNATETPTPWFRLCLAPRRLTKWRVLSIPQTSLSRRIAACLTAHVRRSVWERGVGEGSKGSHTTVSCHILTVFCLFLSAQEMVDIKRFIEKQLPPLRDEWLQRSASRRSEPSGCFLDFQRGSVGREQYRAVAAAGDGDDVCPDRPERNHVTSWYGAQRQRRVTVAALRKF